MSENESLLIRLAALEQRLSHVEKILQQATQRKKEPVHSDLQEPNLTLYLQGEPLLVFQKNGKILHKGKPIGRDTEIVEALRSFLLAQGHIKNPKTPVN